MNIQKFIPPWLLVASLAAFYGCGKSERGQAGSPETRTGTEAAPAAKLTDQSSLTNSTGVVTQQLAHSGANAGKPASSAVTAANEIASTSSVPSTPVAPPAAIMPDPRPKSADGFVRLAARPGSLVRIEGTSSIHDWQVVSSLIGGSIEVASSFPLDPGAPAQVGTLPVQGEVFVTARSLKSVKSDGSAYSDLMDKIMHEKLLAQDHTKLVFRPQDLNITQAPDQPGDPVQAEAKGELHVAGVGVPVTFPVKIERLGEGKAKISGTMSLKMTDFKIEPPSPAGMFIKTGDAVKILFDWSVMRR